MLIGQKTRAKIKNTTLCRVGHTVMTFEKSVFFIQGLILQ